MFASCRIYCSCNTKNNDRSSFLGIGGNIIGVVNKWSDFVTPYQKLINSFGNFTLFLLLVFNINKQPFKIALLLLMGCNPSL